MFKIAFQQVVALHRDVFHLRFHLCKVDNPRIKLGLQRSHQRCHVVVGNIHLVDEDKRRNMISFQQVPDRMRMRLHAVDAADQYDRVVQHLQRALHFRTEVDVAGCVQQCEFSLLPREHRLF